MAHYAMGKMQRTSQHWLLAVNSDENLYLYTLFIPQLPDTGPPHLLQ